LVTEKTESSLTHRQVDM